MRKIHVFTTNEELYKAFQRERVKGDDFPALPTSVYLVFDGYHIYLSGEGSENFGVELDAWEFINFIFVKSSIALHVT